MGLGSRIKLAKMVLNGYTKSFSISKKKAGTIDHDPIDFVVTWVDGKDPAWQSERALYLGENVTKVNGNGEGRYRDWDSFRYWFRAVEKYSPWVRYVHLVTWGHVPEWINTFCPKLKIVKHTDFIPTEFLPTFNSNPIELNLFRIPGLSEHFVYFNDDTLLCRPVAPTEFFVGEKPKHSAIAIPCINRDNEIPYHLFFNTYGLANKKNDIIKCIEKNPEKWFSHLYKSQIKYNFTAWNYAGLSSMYFTHMGVPFCKSTMELTWKKYEKECVETSSYKFRDIHQITHQIFSIEDILSGNFEPSICDWGTCILIDEPQQIADAYESQRTKMICLFDRDNLSDEEIKRINQDLVAVFERFLPEASSFEI